METKPNDPIHMESAGKPCHFNTPMLGLTKREHFAVIAMQGILAGQVPSDEFLSNLPEIVATRAVKHADALICALNKKKGE